MNRDELAQLLDGRQYLQEMSDEEERAAKDAGLLVVFGASDDLIEFRGLIYDEAGAYDGESVLIDGAGPMPSERSDRWSDDEMADYFARKSKAAEIETLWCAEGDYSWTYRTDLPHATFEIVEDGVPFCRGLVIDGKDLP